MGPAAGKLDVQIRGVGREAPTRLRLVPPPRKAARSSASSSPAVDACRSAFQAALVALLALTLFGLARVALSAKVTESSMDALKLEKTLKAETRIADRLELDKSMLVTPSRIESIAAGPLRMTKAPALLYISVPGPASVATPAASTAAAVTRSSAPAVGHALSGVLGAALDVTEREARTLLVGDVGLAASR